MSLWEHAICDTEEVWAYLNPAEEDQVLHEEKMEGWVNGASLSVEQFLNRPIKARTFEEYYNGNGAQALYLRSYPVLRVHDVQVSTVSLDTTYTVSPIREDKEMVVDLRTGKMTLLSRAPVGVWFCGEQNVYVKYEAGFSGVLLEPFKAAVKELIQVYWRDMGTNPRVQQLNESIGTANFTGRFDPSKLSHQVQMAIYNWRSVEV